ncbi:probable endochitinase [Folsomia candida]|nr:probable endochitinase [Folsomia candida]
MNKLLLNCFTILLAFSGVLAQEEPCPDGHNFWPDPDCRFYLVCQVPPIRLQCPNELYWNQDLLVCDYPENVPECVGGTRPPTGTSTTTATTTTEIITTDNPSGPCRPEGVHSVPHPELCHAYYICVDGELTEPYHECPDGFYFDPNLEECNFASEVDCEYGPTPTTSQSTITTTPAGTTTISSGTTTTPPVNECPPEGEHQLPYPGDCSIYIKCVEGFPILLRCPEGSLFDIVDRICKPEGIAVCSNIFYKGQF